MTRYVKQILYESELHEAESFMVKLLEMHGPAGLFEKQEIDAILHKKKVKILNELY